MATIFALKQFAEDQNRRIGLNTEFGEDGKKMYEGLKAYAIKTSFSMDESVVLGRRASMTQGLGIDTTEKNLEAVKGIGNVLIASAVKKQDMQNVVAQISQMISNPRNVDIRQDVKPLINAGLPITNIITEFLQSAGDKSITFQKKFDNGGINNKLVFDALMWYSRLPKVIKANIDKENAIKDFKKMINEKR